MNTNLRRHYRYRSGFILHETVTALLILAVLIAGISHIVNRAAQQRRVAEYRALASVEVANIMEELAARDWEQLTQRELPVELSSISHQRLPDPQLRVDIAVEPDEPDVRRIRVAVDWRTAQGSRSRPAVLVAWRHREEEVEP